ncbi:MAG: hypothetical protein GT601_17675 [Acidaminobacter sp.]|uniref:hypothetical protein n=1 Tax=Acidaminobacter sp. TaxID=1872102 RepID=UPI00137C80DD|nr:hypothetical protein [Acidaminobacter sp.]MZQ99500.1 hypothetical protein [Acidaminobacter sp.]
MNHIEFMSRLISIGYTHPMAAVKTFSDLTDNFDRSEHSTNGHLESRLILQMKPKQQAIRIREGSRKEYKIEPLE